MKIPGKIGFVLSAVFLAALLLSPGPCSAADIPRLPDSIERLYNAGQYKQAIEALQEAVDRTPQQASLHYWLGRCFYELRDYTRAISSLEHAISIDPNESEFHDWLGKACGRKAEEANPVFPFSGLNLARRAHREFETAVRLQATNLEAQRDLIRYLLNAPGIVGGGADHANEQIQALTSVDMVEGELAHAEALATHKKYEEAGEQYQKILNSKPQRLGVYLEIAEYDRDHGDGEGMQQAVDAASRLSPGDHRMPYYRGVALVLQKKDLAVAEKDLRTYLDTVPDNAEVPARASAHEWMGKLYELQDKRDQAAEEYQAAITLDPHDKEPHEALKRLQKK